MAKNNAYVVFVGNAPGVYDTWPQCEEQVKGFPGATFKGFPNREQAELAYRGVQPKKEEAPIISTPRSNQPKSISVDSGTSGNPGKMEYRGVWTDTGEEIFHSQVYPVGTNNLGEFLAVVKAIQWVRNIKGSLDIYSDSVTALSWVRDKKIKTSLERNAQTEDLFREVDDALAYLKASLPYPHLYKWNTKLQGEIKADFGRK